MKTYCKSCGEANEYSLKLPICCAFCGKSFSIASSSNIYNPPNINITTTKPASTARVRQQAPPARIQPSQEINDSDDSDMVDLDDDSGIIDVESASNSFAGIEIQVSDSRRQSISSIAVGKDENSPQNKSSGKDVNPPKAPKKAPGRPKKTPQYDDNFIKDFMSDAGTKRNG